MKVFVYLLSHIIADLKLCVWVVQGEQYGCAEANGEEKNARPLTVPYI